MIGIMHVSANMIGMMNVSSDMIGMMQISSDMIGMMQRIIKHDWNDERVIKTWLESCTCYQT